MRRTRWASRSPDRAIAIIERACRRLAMLAPRDEGALRRADAVQTLRAACLAAGARRGLLGIVHQGVLEWLNLAGWIACLHLGRGPRLTEGGLPGPRARGRRGPPMFTDDLRHAVRRLRSQPGTAVLAVAMLTLAIGVTTAMFTVADHLLINPAPFRDPGRLVQISSGAEHDLSVFISQPTMSAWRSSRAFEAVHGVIQAPVVIEGGAETASAGAMWVTPGLFEMLGARPLLGRTFTPGEGVTGMDDRVILSETVWSTVFGRDPAILGRQIRLSGVAATVVGIMPAHFRFPYENTTVWRPFDLDAPPATLGTRGIMAYARLARDLPRDDATKLATVIAQGTAATGSGTRVAFRSLGAGSMDPYSRTAIMMLAAGVGLVFLVLCANVTNLILARTTSRRREFGVCSALGASRGRLLRQAFLENVLLGVVASALGLAAGAGLILVARRYLPAAFLLRTLNPVDIDVRAMLATSALGCLATVGAGLPPAWIGTKVHPADSLRLSQRAGTETRGSRSMTRALLVAEVALATALLVGSGVLVRSFVNLMNVDMGFDARHMMTATISLPATAFQGQAAQSAFALAMQDSLRSVSGVQGVALSSYLPLGASEFSWGLFEPDGPGARPADLTVYSYDVAPEFFEVYGIRVLEGRTFQPGDRANQIVMGATLARTLWSGERAIGRTVTFQKQHYEIIGVVNDIRTPSLIDPRTIWAQYYRPLFVPTDQGTAPVALGSRPKLGLRCRAGCPDASVIRDRIHAVSPAAIVSSVGSVEDRYLEALARPRAAAALAFAFALVAVVAAAGGLFSVLSYAVGRRRREFGIRAAMGARPADLQRLVFTDGLRIAAMGIAIGAACAWAFSRFLATLSFGVTIGDPAVWTTVVGVVACAALVATWRPAVQAMRADPLCLLRED